MAKKRKAKARASKPTARSKKARPSSKRRARTRVATPIASAAAGPIVVGPPILTPLDYVGNFFDADRPGRAVVRPDDLVALRLELRGLSVSAGAPPRLRKTASGKAQ